MCVCVYTHTYACTYIHMYTYTYVCIIRDQPNNKDQREYNSRKTRTLNVSGGFEAAPGDYLLIWMQLEAENPRSARKSTAAGEQENTTFGSSIGLE